MRILVPAPAFAADLVVHADLGAEAAVEQVAADTDRAPADLRAVTLPELMLGRAPMARGTATIAACSVPPMDVAAVEQASRRAESSVLYVDYDAALVELDAAILALGCLDQPMRPHDAARLYFLRGVVAIESDDLALARQAFHQAHVYDPQLAWDEAFPPVGRVLFEEARAAVADRPATLAVRPVPEGARVLIDGREVADPGAVEVSAGEHLVQLVGASVSTIRLRVEPGEAEVLVPSALTEAAAWDLADPERAAPVSAVLGAVVGQGAPLYVALPTGTWQGVTGSPELSLVAAHEPRTGSGRWIGRAGGIGVAAVGAGVTVASFVQGRSMVAAMNAPDVTWADYEDASARYPGVRQRLLVGEALLAGGVVIASVSIALPVGAP